MRSGFAKALAGLAACASALAVVGAAAMPVLNVNDPQHRVGPADIPCVIQAAMRQGVPANVLLALASVEGGKNGQFVRNTNGTDDLGHFQINTMHFDTQSGVFRHVSKTDAAWRGCYNAELAAWFLRQRLDAPGNHDYWVRVATYHSATAQYNTIYRRKLVPLAARWGRWLQANYSTQVSYN
ncbi:transglycosylase SLT domain-containing protein [Comamonas thiooxydans]|uniref:transglycosylase SLT domain-containing protein n=1 Tax=Comamonas thiooxydans TaxID=363952 RepID=UPI001C0EEB3D|nr:transglycosylase SLT domain-containing protein [Comamonas thiooxydans]